MIVDREQRAFEHGLLFERRWKGQRLLVDLADADLDEIADLGDFLRLLPRPRVAGPSDETGEPPDADAEVLHVDVGHDGGHDVVFGHRARPAGMPVPLDRALVGEEVAGGRAIAARAVDRPDAVVERPIRGALQIGVEAGPDDEAAFVEGFAAVPLFELGADVLEEVGRDRRRL